MKRCSWLCGQPEVLRGPAIRRGRRKSSPLPPVSWVLWRRMASFRRCRPLPTWGVTGTAGVSRHNLPGRCGAGHDRSRRCRVGSQRHRRQRRVGTTRLGGRRERNSGRLRGEVTIAPGVDGRPMAVLPMVDTCAKQPVQPTSRVPIINSKRRIAIASSVPFNLSASCYATATLLPSARFTIGLRMT